MKKLKIFDDFDSFSHKKMKKWFRSKTAHSLALETKA